MQQAIENSPALDPKKAVELTGQKKRPPAAASGDKSAASAAPTTTAGGKRRRVSSVSEMGAALKQAAEEMKGLQAELKEARNASAKWLQLQQTNARQATQITGLEAERKALKAAKCSLQGGQHN